MQHTRVCQGNTFWNECATAFIDPTVQYCTICAPWRLQVAASLALSAGSAAAGVTTFNDQGGFPYPQAVCQGDTPWNSFCARSKASTAMAFLAFFFFVPSLFLQIARMAVALATAET